MAFGIIGSDGVNEAMVDDNGAIRAILYDALGNPIPKSRNDALEGDEGLPVMGGFMPGRRARFMRVDSIGTVRTGSPVPRFADTLDLSGSTAMYPVWAQTATTQTQSLANGARTYNSGSTLTTTTGIMDVSPQRFDRRNGRIMRWRQRCAMKWGTLAGPGTNGVIDCGFGAPAAVTSLAVTDGVFWRCTGSGGLTLVYALASAETTLVTLGTFSAGVITSDGSVPGFVTGQAVRVDSFYQWEITIGDDWVFAQILDPETGVVIFEGTYLASRTLVGYMVGSHVAIFNRTANIGGAAATAVQLVTTNTVVEQLDGDHGMSVDDILAGLQRPACINPVSGVSLTNWANSAAPASATLSNTAAGYTTLGGPFQFAAVAGAETDYCLFSISQSTLYRLRIKRIKIQAWVMGAAIATTPTLLNFALDFNASSVDLNSGTHFRETLGMMSAAIAVPIGGAFDREIEWTGNRVTEASRFTNIILRIPVGTATASQIIRGFVSIEGNQE